jgi:hypothetical protein
MTVATATGSCVSIDAAVARKAGVVVVSTGRTRMSRMPPQVRPTAKASSSEMP